MAVPQYRVNRIQAIADRAYHWGMVPIPLLGSKSLFKSWSTLKQSDKNSEPGKYPLLVRRVGNMIKSRGDNLGVVTGAASSVVVFSVDNDSLELFSILIQLNKKSDISKKLNSKIEEDPMDCTDKWTLVPELKNYKPDNPPIRPTYTEKPNNGPSFKKLKSEFELDTFTIKTATGGLHYYFKYNEEISNFSNASYILDNSINYRSDNAISIFAGSIGANDLFYEIVSGCKTTNPDEMYSSLNMSKEHKDEIIIKDMPHWLRGLLLCNTLHKSSFSEPHRHLMMDRAKILKVVWDGSLIIPNKMYTPKGNTIIVNLTPPVSPLLIPYNIILNNETPIITSSMEPSLPLTPSSLTPSSLTPSSLTPSSLTPSSLPPSSLPPSSLPPSSVISSTNIYSYKVGISSAVINSKPSTSIQNNKIQGRRQIRKRIISTSPIISQVVSSPTSPPIISPPIISKVVPSSPIISKVVPSSIISSSIISSSIISSSIISSPIISKVVPSPSSIISSPIISKVVPSSPLPIISLPIISPPIISPPIISPPIISKVVPSPSPIISQLKVSIPKNTIIPRRRVRSKINSLTEISKHPIVDSSQRDSPPKTFVPQSTSPPKTFVPQSTSPLKTFVPQSTSPLKTTSPKTFIPKSQTLPFISELKPFTSKNNTNIVNDIKIDPPLMESDSIKTMRIVTPFYEKPIKVSETYNPITAPHIMSSTKSTKVFTSKRRKRGLYNKKVINPELSTPSSHLSSSLSTSPTTSHLSPSLSTSHLSLSLSTSHLSPSLSTSHLSPTTSYISSTSRRRARKKR